MQNMKKRLMSLALALILVLSLSLPALAADGVTADWSNFRNSDVNMGFTNAKTPTTVENTNLRWAKKLGTGWSAAPSVQLIVDNALIVMSGTTLYKLDLKNGDILAQGTMSAAPNWGYTPPTYANGLIFCPLGGGTVEAFDAKTLTSVWKYQDELGGQSLTPITYADGYIYTGFWNSEKNDANYVCIDVSNGERKWKLTHTGGFYWAGSVVVGDAVIFGSDDGASGSTGDSHLYSVNRLTGEILSDITMTGLGDQRSSMAYSAEKGRVYFTTKSGYLASAAVDAATGKLSDLKSVQQASQATSTPVVYGDYVYFTCGSGVISGSNGAGAFVVANADTLEQYYSVGMLGYPQCSPLCSTAYLEETGKLYFYCTYNGTPGGITLITVDPTKNTADGAKLTEIYDAKGYEQFCITSPICGPDGTIYYKNDSCYVMAVERNDAWLTGLTGSIGKQTGTFSSAGTKIEWVVPVGTSSVVFTPTGVEGSTITVNGGSADTAVTLTDGTGTAEIKVSVGDYSREYTVSIREVSVVNALGSLQVNESNAYGTPLALSPEFDGEVYYYSVLNVSDSRSFENVWPKAADSRASIVMMPIENVANRGLDSTTGAIEVTATNGEYERYAVYFEDDSKPMAVRIIVTAENGDTASYVLVLSKAGAAEAGEALLKKIQEEDKLAADTAAAQKVTDQIGKIGTVTLESRDTVRAARKAYDALTEDQKALVSNLDVLTAAEARWEELRAEAMANPVHIYISIADKGSAKVLQQYITVTDVNKNGVFDVDDALYAAHEAFYQGGAEAGYASASTKWGLGITSLWGDDSGNYGYWLNHASCWSLEDAVGEGDHLVAFVYADGTTWSDAYTRFEKYDYAVSTEKELTLKLEKAGYDDDWNTVFSACAGASIRVYDSEGKILAGGYTVRYNSDGSYGITITEEGEYYVVATGSDPLLVPAVCTVSVKKDADVPPTGDSFLPVAAVLLVSLTGLCVLSLRKKEW